MTEAQRKKLDRYFVALAQQMGLGDWNIQLLVADLDGNGNYAECEVRRNQRHAGIAISDSWLEWSPEFLRETLCHELLHCYMKPLEWGQERAEELMGKPAFHVYTNILNDINEQTVDAISCAWAESLPLPPKF